MCLVRDQELLRKEAKEIPHIVDCCHYFPRLTEDPWVGVQSFGDQWCLAVLHDERFQSPINLLDFQHLVYKVS